MIHIGGKTYEIVKEHRTAWNPEMFRDRYSEVLDRYDYIVGDWGYNQLRLKGFFKDNHPKSTKDTTMFGIMDYINEYCNFGCAYFILEKKPSKDGRGRTIESWESDAEMEGAAAAEDVTDGADMQQGISLSPRLAEADDKQDASEAGSDEPISRAERYRRIERQFRTERSDKQERNGRPVRQDRQARGEQDRGPRSERNEKPDRAERNDRAERGDRGDRNKSNRQQRNRFKTSKQGGQQSGGKPQTGSGRDSEMQRATESVRS
ncbi:YutD-like domain-containing protein [Paenibacillus marinisediminis]